ncbi:hypothetical protein KCU75_g40, partial [Aureobasidium melanogenum]
MLVSTTIQSPRMRWTSRPTPILARAPDTGAGKKRRAVPRGVPDTKDIEADAGEAFVLPERVGDECWTSQALLASDPEDESTEEDER